MDTNLGYLLNLWSQVSHPDKKIWQKQAPYYIPTYLFIRIIILLGSPPRNYQRLIMGGMNGHARLVIDSCGIGPPHFFCPCVACSEPHYCTCGTAGTNSRPFFKRGHFLDEKKNVPSVQNRHPTRVSQAAQKCLLTRKHKSWTTTKCHRSKASSSAKL